jgi:hypothetical protein
MDPSENGAAQCDDGLDNDNDGFVDFRATSACGQGDFSCSSPTDNNETF